MTGLRRLFIYGTLLPGEANAFALRGVPRVGPAATVAAFTLYDLGGGYPALRPGGATSVKGEIFLVDRDRLAALDAFEGHPTLFVRGPVALAGGGEAEAYLMPAARPAPASARIITSGDWRRWRRR